MRQTIRLNEADLHRIVRESVKGILKESQRDLGQDEWMQNRNEIQKIYSEIRKAKNHLSDYMSTSTSWDDTGAFGECLTHLTYAENALDSLNMISKIG